MVSRFCCLYNTGALPLIRKTFAIRITKHFMICIIIRTKIEIEISFLTLLTHLLFIFIRFNSTLPLRIMNSEDV